MTLQRNNVTAKLKYREITIQRNDVTAKLQYREMTLQRNDITGKWRYSEMTSGLQKIIKDLLSIRHSGIHEIR